MVTSTRSKAKEVVVNRASAVGEEVKQQTSEIGRLAHSAITGRAWIYPLQGILYLSTHPALYKPIQSAIVSTITLAAITLALFFLLTYLPQASFLALFSGPLGFIAAVPLVLSEAYVVILALSKLLYLDSAVEDIFDATLLERGHESLVSKGRILGRPGAHRVTTLGKRLGKPLSRFSAASIARYLISLPLNAIPGVGTVLFLLYNGSRAGPGYHARYWQLRKPAKSQQDQFVNTHRAAYTSFGVVALSLNLIPVVGLAFSLSNSVGAALWASDIEKENALASMGDDMTT